MLKIAGSARFSFHLPTTPTAAMRYYSDLERIAKHLKHIDVVDAQEQSRYRLRYESTEMGAYTVTIFCDAQLRCLPKEHRILIEPIDNLPAIRPKAGMNSTEGRGNYTSEGIFVAEGNQTRIDYKLTLEAALPPPLGLRFMPGSITNKVAKGITTKRLREVASSFIHDSVRDFPLWFEQYRQTEAAVAMA